LLDWMILLVLVGCFLALVGCWASLQHLSDITSTRDRTIDLVNSQTRERGIQLNELREELAALKDTGTSYVGSRVVANLHDGASIRGVMVADHPEAIVLEHAEYLSTAQPEGFAGSAVIPRSNVLWLQHLGGSS
jgi:hypothetical protein